jgi:glucuronate isomerase
MEVPYGADFSDRIVRRAFLDARHGKTPDADAIAQFKAAALHELCLMNAARGWTQQFHIGALRNNNHRMMQRLGPDSGFDAIADGAVARPLSRLLDRLAAGDGLAKTIIYNLNPQDNELLVSLMGCFQDGTVPGKIQLGSAWWFLDQKDGIERQLTALSNLGLLSRFVGMLTDSRSFLSYSRHDYFRRILCNLLGGDMEKGLLPRDWKLIGSMVENICHRNAEAYFGL